MSINAISSISIYEYYFSIDNKKDKKKSPLADEMAKYGLTPTEDESLNASLLAKAKSAENNAAQETKEISKSDRPWADIMYQLNLDFNDDPLDDISDIKEELSKLLAGINDEELEKEINDLEHYVENLYISFSKNNASSDFVLTDQLNNMSVMNLVGRV